MPYVITTRREGPYWGPQNIISESRHAVATLEEARDYARAECERVDGAWLDYSPREIVTESGGTIGPLPDGTVIEVRELRADDLASLPLEMRDRGDIFEIIDAYNARGGGS